MAEGDGCSTARAPAAPPWCSCPASGWLALTARTSTTRHAGSRPTPTRRKVRTTFAKTRIDSVSAPRPLSSRTQRTGMSWARSDTERRRGRSDDRGRAARRDLRLGPGMSPAARARWVTLSPAGSGVEVVLKRARREQEGAMVGRSDGAPVLTLAPPTWARPTTSPGALGRCSWTRTATRSSCGKRSTRTNREIRLP